MQGRNGTTNIQVEDRPLGKRQLAILQFVRYYLQQHGRPPALREIGRGVGLRSTSNVNYHLNRLVERGYLGRQPGAKRTLVVLDAGHRRIGDPTTQELRDELAALQVENRRLREWCRQLERERDWERDNPQHAHYG